ncbi:MAG TPA: hypothetical protein VGJ00_06565 [Rhabdochlamydiaceae bacterium]|jgi:hypothetical protein
MKRLVGLLLVVSVSLYSAPLKADSYGDDSSPDTPCAVMPEPTEQRALEEQNASWEQNAIQDQTSGDQGESEYTQVDTGNYSDQETLVSSETPEHVKHARNKRWQNILIAVAAVAVAITALILVHQNQGHKSK